MLEKLLEIFVRIAVALELIGASLKGAQIEATSAKAPKPPAAPAPPAPAAAPAVDDLGLGPATSAATAVAATAESCVKLAQAAVEDPLKGRTVVREALVKMKLDSIKDLKTQEHFDTFTKLLA